MLYVHVYMHTVEYHSLLSKIYLSPTHLDVVYITLSTMQNQQMLNWSLS